MKSNKIQQSIIPSLAAIVLLALSQPASATPYACDITNAAGVVSFRLNEDADNVKIISSGGAVTNDLGARVKGLTVTNLGIAAGVIKVMVTRSAPLGYTQSTTDGFQDNGVYVNKFEQPRGVVVNKNPTSAAFGRIYVANARGQATTSGTFVRTNYQGIYMINSDDTVALDTGITPRTAGLPFTAGNVFSPFRLSIGKDDNLLYICDDADPSGGLWVTDLNVATNSIATNVLWQIGDSGFGATNHGSIYAAVVEGTLAGGNLTVFTMDEDLPTAKTPWRYDVGFGPYPSTAGQVSLGQTAMINTLGAIDLVRGGPSNYVYASQNRSAGTDAPSIQIFTRDGVTVTNSLDFTRNFLGNPTAADFFRNVTAMDISPDGTTLALLRGSAFGSVLLVPITNGIFNLAGTNSFPLGTSSDNYRDIAYDAAGNLYVVNTASEFLRIFSKGGASVATTGTDGTFALTVPPTLVSVAASTPNANEQGPVNGVFTITRVGDTSVPLTINYTVAGTATPGSDYTALPGSVTFLAGAASTNITVQVTDDNTPELTETVILNITGSANYGVTTGSATVSIFDNEATEVSVTLAQTENRLLEGYSAAKVGFLLTRRGLIGPAVTANLSYSGTATVGADYNAPATALIAANAATTTINITPIDDELYEGTETANMSVAPGTGYIVGTTNTASAVIIDDDYPNGIVLFSDNFDTDSSGNWVTNANDAFFDSAADFAFDYSQLFVPPVPGSSSTKGLRFRLNEIGGASAPRNAVSASPAVLNLPSDYCLKFKAWVNYNGPMFDGGSGSTMHLTAGVGTTPDHANYAFYGGSDGIWFDCDGDGGSTFTVGDLSAYVAATLQADDSGVYAAGTNDHPRSTGNAYYSLWGSIPAPAAQLANFPTQTGTAQPGNMGEAWHTFVITKATNAVVLVIDGFPIATVPADVTPLSTNVFVGFEDLFAGASGNPPMSFVLIENLRVETFVSAPIIIADIRIVGASVEVTFSGPAAAVPGDFKLQSSALVNGTYADDNSANISSVGSGLFKATTALNGPARFYRIR